MPENNAARNAQHQEIVQEMVRVLSRRGYDQIATAGGERDDDAYYVAWEETDQRFMPDITAARGDREYLFAVETAATLRNPIVQEKLELFSEYARASGKFFGLVVPRDVMEEARAILNNLSTEPERSHVIGF